MIGISAKKLTKKVSFYTVCLCKFHQHVGKLLFVMIRISLTTGMLFSETRQLMENMCNRKKRFQCVVACSGFL